MKRIAVMLAAAMTAVAIGASADDRTMGDTRVFARIPAPGSPEGIAVRDGVVYVGTHAPARGNANQGPSVIFTYDLATGQRLPRTYTISGQNLSATHGLLSIAFDADGRLYVLDRNPARMLRIDTDTGAQETYATFPDLKPCATMVYPSNCSPTTIDEPAFPDYFAFDAEGNAYVTDLQAATIFRVPPGGTGTAAAPIWFQDSRLDSIFGPNGIAVTPDGARVLFAMTGSMQPATPTLGIIYSLPRVDDPRASDLQVVYTYPEPATGPDGIALGAGGERLYVALAGSNQVSVLDLAARREVARFPDAASNATRDVPYDLPASIAFDGAGSILVTNQSFFLGRAEAWAVLDAWVGDPGEPLIEPDIAP